MRIEKIDVVLNSNALHGLSAECPAFLCHGLFVGEEPPKAGTEQSQDDDQDSNDLSR